MSMKASQTSWKKLKAVAVTFDKFTNKPFLIARQNRHVKSSQVKEATVIYSNWDPRKMYQYDLICERRLHPPNYVIFWIWEKDLKMCMRSVINCYIYLRLSPIIYRPGWSVVSQLAKKKPWVMTVHGGAFVFHYFGNLSSRNVSKFILLGHQKSMRYSRNGDPG